MGAYGGPDIITEGANYLIDAGSERSYSGSGTTVNSLMGTASSTMYNGVGFQSGVAHGTWRFDGVNDYIKTTDVLVSSPSKLTIGGWFRRNGANTTWACPLHHGTDYSVGGSSFFIAMQSGNYQLVATIGANTTNIGWGPGSTGIYASQDVWYHVISTWDGSVVKVYVDGVNKATYNLSAYTSLTTPTRVGASADGEGYILNGDVAHVFVAPNTHFTAAEVLQNYNAQKNRFI